MFTSIFLLLALADDAPAAANSPTVPTTAPADTKDEAAPVATPDVPPAPAPVVTAPVEPPPAAKPDDDRDALRLHIDDLENQLKTLSKETAAAKAEARAAHARADLAYAEAHGAGLYHSGVGIGMLAPLGEGHGRFGLSGNLHWLTAQWLPAHGVGAGIAPTIEVWRLRLRVFDLGVFYDYGSPQTVPDIQRKLDITLATGIDARLWKGLALHTQVGWFLPNPVSLYDAAQSQYDAAHQNGGSNGDMNNPLGDAQNSVGDAKNAGQYALRRLASAFKSPFLTVAVEWQF